MKQENTILHIPRYLYLYSDYSITFIHPFAAIRKIKKRLQKYFSPSANSSNEKEKERRRYVHSRVNNMHRNRGRESGELGMFVARAKRPPRIGKGRGHVSRLRKSPSAHELNTVTLSFYRQAKPGERGNEDLCAGTAIAVSVAVVRTAGGDKQKRGT